MWYSTENIPDLETHAWKSDGDTMRDISHIENCRQHGNARTWHHSRSAGRRPAESDRRVRIFHFLQPQLPHIVFWHVAVLYLDQRTAHWLPSFVVFNKPLTIWRFVSKLMNCCRRWLKWRQFQPLLLWFSPLPQLSGLLSIDAMKIMIIILRSSILLFSTVPVLWSSF